MLQNTKTDFLCAKNTPYSFFKKVVLMMVNWCFSTVVFLQSIINQSGTLAIVLLYWYHPYGGIFLPRKGEKKYMKQWEFEVKSKFWDTK